jgi:hypothetical protein
MMPSDFSGLCSTGMTAVGKLQVMKKMAGSRQFSSGSTGA